MLTPMTTELRLSNPLCDLINQTPTHKRFTVMHSQSCHPVNHGISRSHVMPCNQYVRYTCDIRDLLVRWL